MAHGVQNAGFSGPKPAAGGNRRVAHHRSRWCITLGTPTLSSRGRWAARGREPGAQRHGVKPNVASGAAGGAHGPERRPLVGIAERSEAKPHTPREPNPAEWNFQPRGKRRVKVGSIFEPLTT